MKRRANVFLEEVALAMAFVAVIIGVGLTDFAPTHSVRYWSFVGIILGVVSTFLGTVALHRQDKIWKETWHLARQQVLHWAGVLVIFLSVFYLLHAGRLNYEGAGLVLGLFLGFATFSDGVCRKDWRFALLGVGTTLAALTASLVETFIWPLLLIFIVIGGLIIVVSHRRAKKKTHSAKTG